MFCRFQMTNLMITGCIFCTFVEYLVLCRLLPWKRVDCRSQTDSISPIEYGMLIRPLYCFIGDWLFYPTDEMSSDLFLIIYATEMIICIIFSLSAGALSVDWFACYSPALDAPPDSEIFDCWVPWYYLNAGTSWKMHSICRTQDSLTKKPRQCQQNARVDPVDD